MKDFFMSMDFMGKAIDVHVITLGHGKKQILCLHGFLATGMETFGKILSFLEKDYTLVLIDWIGFGHTTRFLSPSDTYDSTYLSTWLESFINTALKKKILKDTFSIFAVSMSGLMTGMVYDKVKDHVEKIIFVNPAGFDRKVSMKFAMVIASPFFTKKTFLKIITKSIFWEKMLGLKDVHRKKLFSIMDSGELEVYSRAAQHSMTRSGNARPTHIFKGYGDIKIPVMLICSTKDTLIINQEYVQQAKKYGWKIKMIKNNDHVLIARKPSQVANAVKEFL